MLQDEQVPATLWDAFKMMAPPWFQLRYPVRWRRQYRLDSAELTEWVALFRLRAQEAEKARKEAERKAKLRR